ncbi:hypothetical protein GCM10025793_09100 [Lysobacter lycopersici]
MGIESFNDILLEDSFVFGWRRASESLSFNIDASLLQTHPRAMPPSSGEWACYKSGVILFSGVSSVSGLLPQESVRPTLDPDGSADYGCIDDLSVVQPGEYRIAGEFGVVTVLARDVTLVFDDVA